MYFITMALSATLILLLNACATIEPHENFKQGLRDAIGTTLEEQKLSYRWLGAREPISVENLPNGNIENTYLYMTRYSCKFAFEVDPIFHRILNARIVEGEQDCFINP